MNQELAIRPGAYSIRDLVQRTGVPAASIHHYRRRGLLPPPHRSGPSRAAYGEEHVEALRLIRLLRERRRLGLPAIAEILPFLLASDEAFRPDLWAERLPEITDPGDRPATLLRAAATAFSAEPYPDVSVDHIAAGVGMAKATVYRHFASKEDLFLAAVATVTDDVVARWEQVSVRVPMAEERAVRLLAELLRCWLPLVLDLTAGGLRRDGPRWAAARDTFTRLAEAVAPRLSTRADEGSASRIVTRAVAMAIRAGLDLGE